MNLINVKNFKSVDNIKHDVMVEKDLIQRSRAIILLQNNLKLGLFLNAKAEDSAIIQSLEETITLYRNNDKRLNNDWSFSTLRIEKSIFTKADKFGQTGQIRLIPNIFRYNANLIQGFNWDRSFINQANRYTNILQVVEEFGYYHNAVGILKFYDVSSNIYDPINRSGIKMKEDTKFYCLTGNSNVSGYDMIHADQVDSELFKLILGDSKIIPHDAYEKIYNKNIQMLFSFNGASGDILMKAAQIYFVGTKNYKIIVPITQWHSSDSTQKFYYSIPKQGKQPLLNLDILSTMESPDVIICDNIEIAYANQNSAKENVVFTAWLCDSLEYVDFSPLANAKSINFLITNHSDKSIEEQYLAVEELSESLQEMDIFENIPFNFIQIACEYEKHNQILDFAELLELDIRGKVIPESYKQMNQLEFSREVLRAKEYIENKSRNFWDSESIQVKQPQLGELKQVESMEYLLNPILIKGQQTSLYGAKNSGKSMLGYNIATVLTSIKKKGRVSLFEEIAWNRSSIENYPCRKVLYLDFENGSEEMNDRIKLFGNIYWKKNKEISRNNLFPINMQDDEYQGKDYSKVENHQVILDLVERARHQGIPDQPVDIIIIDTYNKFVSQENISTNKGFTKLSSTLRKMGIAILVIGQLSSDNKSSRGFKQKLDDDYITLITFRENEHRSQAISDKPTTLKLENCRGKKNTLMVEELSIIFDEKCGFRLNTPKNHNESEYVTNYADCIYQNKSREEVAKILGFPESTFYGKMKK